MLVLEILAPEAEFVHDNLVVKDIDVAVSYGAGDGGYQRLGAVGLPLDNLISSSDVRTIGGVAWGDQLIKA